MYIQNLQYCACKIYQLKRSLKQYWAVEDVLSRTDAYMHLLQIFTWNLRNCLCFFQHPLLMRQALSGIMLIWLKRYKFQSCGISRMFFESFSEDSFMKGTKSLNWTTKIIYFVYNLCSMSVNFKVSLDEFAVWIRNRIRNHGIESVSVTNFELLWNPLMNINILGLSF